MSEPCINLMPALYLLVQVAWVPQMALWKYSGDRGRWREGWQQFLSQLPDFLHHPLLFPHSLCRGLGGPLPGATPSWAGELGEILPKVKAAVYKHLDLQVIWVTICFTMELFTLQMIHLLRKRLLGTRV